MAFLFLKLFMLMEFLCKHCENIFEKELTLVQKLKKYKPKFCCHDCEVEGLKNKKKSKVWKRKIGKTSKEEREFGNVLAKFYRGLKRQYQLSGYYHRYDFFCPELGILIEYDSVYFHSMTRNRIKDHQHNLVAKKQNIPISRITDKEWKQVLKEGLNREKLIRVIKNNIID